jgi:hypothetical protein
MKTTKIMASLLAMSLLLPACSSVPTGGIRIGSTPAGRMAKDPQIPGKGVPGQCLPFAMALQQKFQAAGVPSKVLVFGYETSSTSSPGAMQSASGGSGNRGAHAVVAYDDGGRTYLMDNQSWTPQWVHDAAPMQMAQRFAGIQYSVKMAHVVHDANFQAPPLLPSSGTRLAAE